MTRPAAAWWPVLSLILPLSLAGAPVRAELAPVRAVMLDYLEQEPGLAPTRLRVLVTAERLRIDAGSPADDYLLLDRPSGTLHSVTHGDRHILTLPAQPEIGAPPAELELAIEQQPITAAPRIGGHEVLTLRSLAGDQTCLQAHVVPGLLPGASAALADYARLLGRRALSSLHTTPAELRSPCMLANQVYASDAAYAAGLVVDLSEADGSQRRLQDFRRELELSPLLFELPTGYRETRWQPPSR